MTVQQLIDRLSTMPRDVVVIHTMCSDYEEIADDEPTLITAEEKKLCLRGGRIISYHPRQWPADEKPVFVTRVHFSGN